MVLIGTVAVTLLVASRDPSSRGIPPPSDGVIRLDGQAFVDDDRAIDALGTTLFWLAWGYKHDRPKLERNLDAVRAIGADYIRALAVVGPSGGWEDREIDPRWPDFEAVIAGATDLAYDRFGLRVQWTIFGGLDHARTAEARAAIVDTIGRVAAPRAHKLLFIEIANEAGRNGFAGARGIEELRALRQRLRTAVPNVLVALSAPGSPQELCEMYGGPAADVITYHYNRDVDGESGRWGPVADPLHVWRPGAGPPQPIVTSCDRPLPAAVVSNEPIGPQSSIAGEDDPLRLVLAYVTSLVAGHAGYVLHTGPGVRGGGRADREYGRSADMRALPGFDRLAAGFQAAKRYLPDGLANWTRHGAGEGPLVGIAEAVKEKRIVDGAIASRGGEFFGVLLGVRKPIMLTARRAVTLEVIDPLSGNVLAKQALGVGKSFEVQPRPRGDGDGLVMRGTITDSAARDTRANGDIGVSSSVPRLAWLAAPATP